MKILLVTGKMAEPLVKEALKKTKSRHDVDIVVLPVQVISLLSTHNIAEMLRNRGIKGYDLMIVPGACRGSTREIEELLGIPCVKGPLHAHDIPLVLGIDDPSKVLSREKPADEVLKDMIIGENLRILREIESKLEEESIDIGGLKIPYRPPPLRIISEIGNAHLSNEEEVVDRVYKLVDEGADIISIGFEPMNPHPDLVYRVVRRVKEECDVPIALDSLIPSEIESGIRAGIDMVMSIDQCNAGKILDHIPREEAIVLIPYDSCSDTLPRDHATRVDILDKLVKNVEEKGFEKIVLDPILDPPIIGSIIDSLNTYKYLKEKYPRYPLLMGIGNVVELMDIDSIGLNGLLALLALETGVSLLLTIEASSKTQGSTRELSIASQMISIAYQRKTPPKDLGLDLLMVKDKRKYTIPIEKKYQEVRVDYYPLKYEPDPRGVFRINVNHREGVIEALYVGEKGELLIKSRSAEALSNYIVENELVSTLSHAIYLGRELGKAEEALRIGKNYIQDQPLFTKKEALKLD